jgi:protein-L-isoaspartate(D-aspartate) O-methyltransferase
VSTAHDRDTARRAAELAAGLRARGVLADPRWQRAISEVPRHLFAPARAWAQPAGEAEHIIDADGDPQEWLRQVYAPATAIITQREEARAPAASGEGTPTSSLSEPTVVAEFLELLEIRDGNKVLEIGTGSGWTAALLSHRVGEGQVTTVEVDSQVAGQAVHNLKAAGWAPRVVVGDGAAGWPAGAPYDRVHVGCGVAQIPVAWAQQCRPGAVIVLPWLPSGYNGHQMQLRVGADGSAVGRFGGGCGYMMMRSQRTRWNSHHASQARTSAAQLDPREVAAGDPGLQILFAALLPGITQIGIHDSDGSFSLLLSDHDGEAGSWAACDYDSATGDCQVTQFGDRPLWEETEAAYGQWLELGAPARARFGLTVDADGQHVWLDTPSRVICSDRSGQAP